MGPISIRRGYAPKAAQFLLLSIAEHVPFGRRLVVNAPLVASDGGARGDFQISLAGASALVRGAIRLAGQLGGTPDEPDVRGIRVTNGSGVLLTFGAVGDNQALIRSGDTIVGGSVPPSSRHVDAGVGLAGGGDLTVNRTISLAAFTGMVSKDFPSAASLLIPANSAVDIGTIDATSAGHLMPVGIRLPPTDRAALRTEFVLEFAPSDTKTVFNTSGSNQDSGMQMLSELCMGDFNTTATNNGKRIQRIICRIRNSTGTDETCSFGIFRVRAWCLPKGAGTAL